MLELRDAAVRRGRFRRSYSTDLANGVTLLRGSNGSGKTSLLLALATLLRFDSGSASLDGMSYSKDNRARIRSLLGYCPQNFVARPSERVIDLVRYCAWLSRVPARENYNSSMAALESVQLAGRANEQFGRLSGGMRRRVGVAQAIVHRPRLLLLDEPDAGLDANNRARLMVEIQALSKESITLMTSHQATGDLGRDVVTWTLSDTNSD